jgi:acyl-CoA thioesterase I
MAVSTLAAMTPNSQQTPLPTLVVLGDSLSAGYGIRLEDGWVALLRSQLQRQGYGVELINASVSGETSAGGLARLPHILEKNHPTWLIIELGANDGLRGLPTQELHSNLTALVKKAKAEGVTVLLIGIRIPSNYGTRYVTAFAKTFAQVAAQQHVAITENLLSDVPLEDKNFQADHLHPTAAVQNQLTTTVWRTLEPLMKNKH